MPNRNARPPHSDGGLGLLASGRIVEAKTLIDEVLVQYPLSEVALCVEESVLDRIAEEAGTLRQGSRDPDASSASLALS